LFIKISYSFFLLFPICQKGFLSGELPLAVQLALLEVVVPVVLSFLALPLLQA